MKRDKNMTNTHTPTDVVKCEWSGNRANAFDTDGNKRTFYKF